VLRPFRRPAWSGLSKPSTVGEMRWSEFDGGLLSFLSDVYGHNKFALTDHATQENHVINWSQATVIDREPERFTRWIKEAIHIRKEGQQAMNRDEGSYQQY